MAIATFISFVVFLLMSPEFGEAVFQEEEPQGYLIRGIKFNVIKEVRVNQMDMKAKNTTSVSHCAVLCAADTCCLQANYNNNNGSCNLLIYHEIPSQWAVDNQWDMLSIDCTDEMFQPSGVSSCDMVDEERGARRFTTVQGAILKGNDDDFQYGMELEDCRDFCVSHQEFQCRSIDYIEANQLCQLSRSTRDDESNTLEYLGDGHIYEQRIC